jgi:hypothetical protein
MGEMNYARMIFIGFLAFVTSVFAGEQTMDTSTSSFFGLFQSWFDLLFGGALGTGLGFLIKWALEQWSLRVAARREFAQKVTDQISNLASKHYWSLANYAGVVAGLLEGYLCGRFYHLIVLWDDKAPLNRRLDELADEATIISFPHLCRLIALFDAFQFKESNTYLLTDHPAGETCKRLYNTFLGSLPEKLNLANLYALEIPVEEGAKKKVGEIPAAYLTEAVIDKYLPNEKKIWRDWLRNDLEGVIQAADALRAYNELLLHELANLYRDWFKQEQPDIPYLEELVLERWPNVLTEQSFVAIGRARQQTTLLSPLGAAISGISASPEERMAGPEGAGEARPQSGAAPAKEPPLPPTKGN